MQITTLTLENYLEEQENIQDLIARAKKGEGRAFEELLEIFKKMIYRISKMYYFPDGDFDDVTQECMIAFWSAIESYDKKKAGKNIESYIYLCLTRRMISALRKSTTKNANFTTMALLQSLNIEFPGFGDSLVYPTCNASPETYYMAAELERSYIKAIKEMKIENFEGIANLRYCGYSYKEISEILQLSSKNIDNILYRGRQNLREIDLLELN